VATGDQGSGRPAVDILGVRLDALTRAQAAAEIARLATGDEKRYVVKPYSEFLPRAARDPNVRAILNGAALCLPDGVGILWAAHYLSLPGGQVRAFAQLPLSLATMTFRAWSIGNLLPEAMAGVDLTWVMLKELEAAGASVYLLGGSAGEIKGTREVIERRYPGLRVVGSHHGHFGLRGKASDQVVRAINATAPDALLVAMGFPRQEQWIAANLGQLKVKVAVAEGGSFTFMSGQTSRAPHWMRRAGLEWLFRLLRQPWRLRRQLALPVFVWLVFRERLSRPGR